MGSTPLRRPMRLPRLSLRFLLALVALAALDLALGRHLASLDVWLATGLMPSILLAQFALLQVTLSSRPSRAFWATFAVGSLFTGVCYFLGDYYGPPHGIIGLGPIRIPPQIAPRCFGSDQCSRVWRRYSDFGATLFGRWIDTRPGFSIHASLPPLLFGTTLGFLAHILDRALRGRPLPSPLNPPPGSPSSPP